jgi:uncharacterized protein (DUF2236 family)
MIRAVAVESGERMRTSQACRPRAANHAERLASRDGYFAPESVIRRLGNTPVTPFLGGGTAVLLQVAHPLVAAGVADHSSYDQDIWRRLLRTLRALYLITYGSKAEAERVADSVREAHAHVKGTTKTQLGTFPAGTAYSADDPELMLWVHATLVHASLCAYQRFERTLSPADQQRYYGEMAVVGRLFGIPSDLIPASLADLRDYFSSQLESSTITVTEPAREIARAVFRSPLRGPMRVVTPAHRLATTAQLPPRIREEYDLHLTSLHGPLLAAAGLSVRIGSRPILRVAGLVRPPLGAMAT